MDQALIIRGRYADRTFIPDGRLPDAFGTAPRLRTGEDIAGQIRDERDDWGGR